ncbi:MAG: hypothetical protein ABGY09_07060 [Euryarchaeota archaeon]
MFDHLFRLLFRALDESVERALREIEKEMERLREEAEELKERENGTVREFRLPGGGFVRVETYTIQLPGGIEPEGSLKDRIEELPTREREDRGGFEEGRKVEEIIDVGGIPLKVESRDREWREENR